MTASSQNSPEFTACATLMMAIKSDLPRAARHHLLVTAIEEAMKAIGDKPAGNEEMAAMLEELCEIAAAGES